MSKRAFNYYIVINIVSNLLLWLPHQLIKTCGLVKSDWRQWGVGALIPWWSWGVGLSFPGRNGESGTIGYTLKSEISNAHKDAKRQTKV